MGGGCGGVKTEKPSRCKFFGRKIKKECLALKKSSGREGLAESGGLKKKRVALYMLLRLLGKQG